MIPLGAVGLERWNGSRLRLHGNVLGLIHKNDQRFLAVFVAFTQTALNAKHSLEFLITYH